MIASRALNANHTKNQTIIVLGLMLLASGVVIYKIYKVAEEQIAENNDLLKHNDNLNLVNANLNMANRRLNDEVLYYIGQIATIVADKKKEAAYNAGVLATQNKQA